MSKHTAGLLQECGYDRGGCQCGQIWSIDADHPVAKVEIGDWGDDHWAARIGKNGEPEAYKKAIPYGHVLEDEGKANAKRLADCWNNCANINPEAVPKMVEVLRELLNACERQTALSIGAHLDPLIALINPMRMADTALALADKEPDE